MNRKGSDKILTIYWFFIVFIVTGATVYIASLLYGSPFNVKAIEGGILGDQVANCLTNKGYINNQIFSPDFQANFLKDCHINLNTEDFADWKNNFQYYIGAEVYKFNPSPQQQFYGDFGTNASNNLGDELASISAGDAGLKTNWELTNSPKTFLGVTIPSSLYQRKVTTIVVHATEGANAQGAIEAISTAQLSIHYMIDRDGTIITSSNANSFAPTQYVNAFAPENVIAQHVGCFDTRSNTQRPDCSTMAPNCIDSNGLLDPSCQALSNPPQNEYCCISGFNQISIGIELVNLGDLCTDASYKNSQYCANSVTVDGKQWESYSSAQISSLVTLVSDIASRYNIPLDRNHIIGHYQVTTYKTDPGPQFPWDEFMQELNTRGSVSASTSSTTLTSTQAQRSFYAIDNNGSQYIVRILALVEKIGKNE